MIDQLYVWFTVITFWSSSDLSFSLLFSRASSDTSLSPPGVTSVFVGAAALGVLLESCQAGNTGDETGVGGNCRL